MDRIDEMIANFDKCDCPKRYLNSCPPRAAGNDCDNFCPFVEAVDMLKELKEYREHRLCHCKKGE